MFSMWCVVNVASRRSGPTGITRCREGQQRRECRGRITALERILLGAITVRVTGNTIWMFDLDAQSWPHAVIDMGVRTTRPGSRPIADLNRYVTAMHDPPDRAFGGTVAQLRR